jgi:hypothetical protein
MVTTWEEVLPTHVTKLHNRLTNQSTLLPCLDWTVRLPLFFLLVLVPSILYIYRTIWKRVIIIITIIINIIIIIKKLLLLLL